MLEHDITPTDVTQLGLTEGALPPRTHQARYQGFPGENFSSVRKPITGLVNENDSQLFADHRKGQHFVKGLPPGVRVAVPTHATKLTDSDVDTHTRQPDQVKFNRIQYGSDGLSKSSRSAVTPRKTVFLLEERTSAEERKRAHQRFEAELDISQRKQKKEESIKESHKEKKKDLEMLISYKPWGKPGGGAPKDTELNTRRTKNLEYTVSGDQGELPVEFPGFGKQGHGAPLRSDSGNLRTSVRANHDIRFQTGVKNMALNVHDKIRYAQSHQKGQEYIHDLENLALEKKTRKEIEKQQDFEEEIKTWSYDPFGKSGGGAPIKTDSGRDLVGRNRTLVKNSYELRDVEEKQERKHRLSDGSKTEGEINSLCYNPWGRGSGAPDRDADGNIRRYKWTDGKNVPDFVDPDIRGISLEMKPNGGGGHKVDAKGEKLTKIPQTLVHDQQTGGPLTEFHSHSGRLAHDPEDVPTEAYGPWGRPGNGAPIRDDDGYIVAVNQGKAEQNMLGLSPPNEREQTAKKEYLNQLKREISDQHHLRDEETREIREPAAEVATWIRTKEVGYPKRDPVTKSILPIHYKQTSDVTAQRMDIRRPVQLDLYQNDLERQAMERYQANAAKKQESRDLSIHHQENFDRLWGRPGNGAPANPPDHKRHVLDAETGNQDDLTCQPPWIQPHGSDVVHKPWARTTALQNRFQTKSQQNLPRKEYSIKAPWASI